MTTVAGGPTTKRYLEGNGTAAGFYCPCGVAYQPAVGGEAARLLVADQQTHRFRAIDLKTGLTALRLMRCIASITYCCAVSQVLRRLLLVLL